jgi:hypothetical protein
MAYGSESGESTIVAFHCADDMNPPSASIATKGVGVVHSTQESRAESMRGGMPDSSVARHTEHRILDAVVRWSLYQAIALEEPPVATDVNVISPVDVYVDDLPTVQADVVSMPDIRITDIGAMGPLTLAGIPSNYTVGISTLPDVNLRIREIPSFRAHIPANFRLGFSVLGVELAALHLCGEAQVITEPYAPNACERCNAPKQTMPRTNDVGAILRLANE